MAATYLATNDSNFLAMLCWTIVRRVCAWAALHSDVQLLVVVGHIFNLYGSLSPGALTLLKVIFSPRLPLYHRLVGLTTILLRVLWLQILP